MSRSGLPARDRARRALRMPLVLGLIGCRSTDAELAGTRAALDAWRRGERELAEGRPADAVVELNVARGHRPKDVLLTAWHAKAVAAAGDPEEAARLLAEALAARPDFAVARYNRAAYLARAGALDEAGKELARALADGAADPRDAVLDPDFQPHLGSPAFAFLPTPGLEVVTAGPDAPVFWGSRADVALEIRGARSPVEVRGGSFGGPVELVRVVHDTTADVQRLRFTFKVIGGGQAVVGPFDLGDAGAAAHVDPVGFTCTAPEDKAVPAPATDNSLSTPLQLGGEGLPPSVVESAGRLLVKLGPTDRVELNPPASRPPETWELQRNGELAWTLLIYEISAPTGVRVWTEGGLALETSVPGG